MADEEPQDPRVAGRKLQVANAKKEDSGRGLARMSRQVMASLGLVQGDVVEIEGKRSTPARAIVPRTPRRKSASYTSGSALYETVLARASFTGTLSKSPAPAYPWRSSPPRRSGSS